MHRIMANFDKNTLADKRKLIPYHIQAIALKIKGKKKLRDSNTLAIPLPDQFKMPTSNYTVITLAR